MESLESAAPKKGPFYRFFSRFYYGSIVEYNKSDHIHQWLLRLTAMSVVLLLGLLLLLLFKISYPAIKEFGPSFIFTNEWNPVSEKFGALAFIHGTLFSSLLSILIAAPIGIGLALFITELCPRPLKILIISFSEMLAAIPSIVYGLWALFFLSPMVRDHMAPFFQETLGLTDFFLFQGASFGIGMITATLVLSIMIIPTITAVSVEVFKSMPLDLKHAALALGSTRWEAIYLAVLRPGWSGVCGAIILGLGRALGETMAVAMVIGNRADISFSIFSPASTMSSVIANEYAEATGGLHMSALGYIGLLLFGVSFIINFVARFFVWRITRVSSGPAGVR